MDDDNKALDHDRCIRCIRALLAIIEGNATLSTMVDVVEGARQLLADLNADTD